jgi:RNA-binding protein
MLSKKDRKRLRKAFTHSKQTIAIGKNGVTATLIHEVLKQLKTNEVIKIRVLKSALQQNSFNVIKNTLLERIDVDLVDSRGHNILVYKAS